jgi:LmbE family N-acetylglucosaminyl deacetylase
MKILVLAGHPDDEVLGVGGTIARMTSEKDFFNPTKGKHDVRVGILSRGLDARGKASDEQKKKMKLNMNHALMTLGVKRMYLADLPDNQFDSIPLLKIVKIIESWVSDFQPDIIFTHSMKDLNIDHRITGHATLIATRPMDGRYKVRSIYAYEIPSSTEWAFGQLGEFNPNVFFDISGTFQTKINAMEQYKSETRNFPHPRSTEAITAYASLRGSAVGCKATEAFELIRTII